MEAFFSLDGLISLLTLTLLEIVLGIDNIIFISIFSSKLPAEQQPKARSAGIFIALAMRVVMLLGIAWIIKLDEPLFSVFEKALSIKDLILLSGGIFLIAKTTSEMHSKLEKKEQHAISKAAVSLTSAVVQIVLIDMVFSIDSILTAIGLVREVEIMIAAVIISMLAMFFFAKPVSNFVEKHPTVKMLALSFLLMIGVLLTAEAFHVEVPKGYIYFAMAFAFLVEMLNIRVRKNHT